MATSGSYLFDPTFANILDEAAERAGMDPATLSSRHLNSAKMSMALMFTEWVGRDGDALYRVTQDTEVVPVAATTFSPQTGTMDIIDMVVEYNASGVDSPMLRKSRQDYLTLTDKDDTGQPTYYYVDQSNLNAPLVYIWPVPDADCTFRFDCLRYMQTPGYLSETLDVQRPWLDACCAGLALRLAEKYKLDRVPLLEPKYEKAYGFARMSGGGRSEVILSGRSFGSRQRTIRR
jgi:hypothetical protein